MTGRPTTAELNAALARMDEVLEQALKGRAVNLSFARRKGLYGTAPDFRAQLVGPVSSAERSDS